MQRVFACKIVPCFLFVGVCARFGDWVFLARGARAPTEKKAQRVSLSSSRPSEHGEAAQPPGQPHSTSTNTRRVRARAARREGPRLLLNGCRLDLARQHRRRGGDGGGRRRWRRQRRGTRRDGHGLLGESCGARAAEGRRRRRGGRGSRRGRPQARDDTLRHRTCASRVLAVAAACRRLERGRRRRGGRLLQRHALSFCRSSALGRRRRRTSPRSRRQLVTQPVRLCAARRGC